MMVNDAASSHCFTAVENFDTDILSCLSDPKKALSYQTGSFYSSTWPLCRLIARLACINSVPFCSCVSWRFKKIHLVWFADLLYRMSTCTGAECRRVSCCTECPRAPVLSADKCVVLYRMSACTGAECRQVCHVVQNVRVHRCWVQTSVSCCVECPRAPVLSADKCVVSNDRAHISIQYNETVRVRSLRVLYKAAMDKALSEKCWDSVDITDVSHGSADVTLNSLQRGTMYRAYAVASNDVGDSLPSDELWFHTVDCEHVDVRVVSKWIMFSCSFTGWNSTCRSRDFCTLYLYLSGTYLFQLLVLVLGSEWSTYHYFKFFRHFNFLNFVFKTLA